MIVHFFSPPNVETQPPLTIRGTKASINYKLYGEQDLPKFDQAVSGRLERLVRLRHSSSLAQRSIPIEMNSRSTVPWCANESCKENRMKLLPL